MSCSGKRHRERPAVMDRCSLPRRSCCSITSSILMGGNQYNPTCGSRRTRAAPPIPATRQEAALALVVPLWPRFSEQLQAGLVSSFTCGQAAGLHPAAVSSSVLQKPRGQ